MCCTRSGDLYNLFSFEDQPSEALEENLLDSESTKTLHLVSQTRQEGKMYVLGINSHHVPRRKLHHISVCNGTYSDTDK